MVSHSVIFHPKLHFNFVLKYAIRTIQENQELELEWPKRENVEKAKSNMATLIDECEEIINYCCYVLTLQALL
jgi:hypothetical protein